MNETFPLNITEEEAKVLLQLIHAALQARGLDAAAAGAHFQQKINSAIADSKKAELGLVDVGEAQPIDHLTK